MTETIITIVGAGVAALAGVVSGSRLSRRMDAERDSKLTSMGVRLHELETERMKKLETDVEQVRRGCRAEHHDSQLRRLTHEVEKVDNASRETDRKMERVITTLENQASAFGGMMTEVKKYVEQTARQDEQIRATSARVGGLHEQFRKHTDDRGLHHG